MKTRLRAMTGLIVAFVLLFSLLAMRGSFAVSPAQISPATVQGLSFSIAADGPATSNAGVHPADILGIGGVTLIPCTNLGLVCVHPISGALDDLNGLSYGSDFEDGDLPDVLFSVGVNSEGLDETAVANEADCQPAEPQADIYASVRDGQNSQVLDGNGTACAAPDNDGDSIGLAEAENIDAVERDPCRSVDLNCDGVLNAPVFFVLAPGSPSLSLLGVSSSDILVASGEEIAGLWASGETALGLVSDDIIDGLCIQENGDGRFGIEDRLVFSLAAGSPTLAQIGAPPADLLQVDPVETEVTAASMGLVASDELNAMLCADALTSGPEPTPSPSPEPSPSPSPGPSPSPSPSPGPEDELYLPNVRNEQE